MTKSNMTMQDEVPTEYEFEDHVEQLLIDEYGEDRVARQFRFLDDRVADLVVFAPSFTFTYELENDGSSILKGMGQALFYSKHFDNGIPVVCAPVGAVDYEEQEQIARSNVTLRLIEFKKELFA